MSRYASNTTVSVEGSRSEIERILRRYHAESFISGWSGDSAMLGFDINSRRYRIKITLPKREEFQYTPGRRTLRENNAIDREWEQGIKQRWRALTLWIKAVLEAQEAGIVSIDEALQSFLVLPGGQTMYEWLAPQIEKIYNQNQLPALVPGISEIIEGVVEDD